MRRFAELCGRLRGTRRTSRKVSLVADYLRSLDDQALPAAARFLTGSPFAARDERTLSIGFATLHRAAQAMFPEHDPETLRECYRAVGEIGEAMGLLQRGRGRAAAPPLPEVARFLVRVSETRRPGEKLRLVYAALAALEPAVLKETVKLLVGSQRIGLSTLLLEQAIARGFEVPLEEVRRAQLLSGDAGEAALRARRGELSGTGLALFHPMGFQLAATYEPGQAPPWERLLIEEKLDGVRCQAHVRPGDVRASLEGSRVRLFSRGLDDVTGWFPEIAERLARLPAAAVLDGEVLAFAAGRALPFAQLQRRIGRKGGDPAGAGVPLVFAVYDLLALGDRLVIDLPLSERRRHLEALPLPEGVLLSGTARVASAEELERAFDAVLAHGNEGLMLKDETAPYAPGKRGRAWLKYKKARATLDVVVTSVEPGHGRRAGLLSDLTFAVRGPAGELLNIGKAYSGLTDDEIEETTRLFRGLTTQSFGRVRLVRPEVVLEVAFDGIQRSARHKSGFALRFPRIVRLRPDKPPGEIDTLAGVERLYLRLAGELPEGAQEEGTGESRPDPEQR